MSVAPLVCALALGLVACGGIDTEELEGQLVEDIPPQFGVDPADASADCPDDVDSEEGTEFECTMSAPDADVADITVDVTLTDDEGGFEAVVPQEQFQEP